jgi:hypothetical protein
MGELVRNKYCEIGVLRNEADVEQNFARRLLEDLGYSDTQILPKQSLDSLRVGGMRGHPHKNYKPDFALRVSRKIRWIVEAKTPDENLDEHEWQARAYCVLLNGSGSGGKVTKFHLLTNGRETRLYDPALNDALLVLKFADFVDGNQKFEQLITIIDDGILSGDDYKWFRDKLREWFLIRSVVSLPGDAFQRSNARVKTSYVIAEKRDPTSRQDQPPVFMYPCQFVGIDDPKRQRARASDVIARQNAEKSRRS